MKMNTRETTKNFVDNKIDFETTIPDYQAIIEMSELNDDILK